MMIYLPAITPRTEYVFELIFKNDLGIEYFTTTDTNVFEDYTQEKINYSYSKIGNEVFIKASGFLFDNAIKKIDVPVNKDPECTVLFPNYDLSCETGFDIFAAVFYMVSRYEEYLSFKPDNHGRFMASESFAYRNNFLQYPVVNIWIQSFKKKLSERFPYLSFLTPAFKPIVTYDIDVAYAFKGRNIFRLTAASAKDILTLNLRNLLNRFRCLFGKTDPWDVYDSLKHTLIKNKLESVFFFLLAEYSSYNKNISFNHPLMIDLIKKIAAYTDIGIHPSYTSVNPEKILIEKSRLEKITGKTIIKSRQHYLRFNLPDTYTELIKAGIREDYSMGFADMPGFRAGICTPIYFYDLKNEKQTKLLLYPFALMDGNFMKYLKKEPDESIEIIFRLIEQVKNVNGTFISVWHNHTLSDDNRNKGWRKVHDAMIEKLVDNERKPI